MDDDQIFHMEVDQDEDRYGCSDQESDEDAEVSFRQSSQTTDGTEDSETDDDEPESEELDYESDRNEEENDQMAGVHVPPLSRQERIKQLDEEMKVRIHELHALVVDGGLEGAAAEMETSFQTPPHVHQPMPQWGMNFNANSNLNKNGSKVTNKMKTPKYINKQRANFSLCSPSEDTINKDTVKSNNRNSSSSDELGIDTSDETLNEDFDGLKLVSGPKVGFPSTS